MSSSKISGIVLYAIVILSIVVFGMFYFGAVETDTVPGTEAPVYTSLLIFFMYGLFGITLITTVGAALSVFVKQFMSNPKEAIKSMSSIIIFVLIFLVSWSLGDVTPVKLIGFQGTENTDPFWLRWIDMILFSSYTLAVIAIVCIASGALKKYFVK